MTKSLKTAIADGLPPQTLFRLRSIKRALMGQPPLEPPRGAINDAPPPAAPPPAEPSPEPEPRTMQTEALERLDAHKISAPYLFFSIDDVCRPAGQGDRAGIDPQRDVHQQRGHKGRHRRIRYDGWIYCPYARRRHGLRSALPAEPPVAPSFACSTASKACRRLPRRSTSRIRRM